MSEDEKSQQAVEQREENNTLLRAINGAIRIAGGLCVTALLAGFCILFTDHFANIERDKVLVKMSLTQDTVMAKLVLMERAIGPKESRWTYGMQTNYASEMAARNPSIFVPDVRKIKEAHSVDSP